MHLLMTHKWAASCMTSRRSTRSPIFWRLQVPQAHVWLLQAARMRMPMSHQRTQLKGEAWFHPQMSRPYPHLRRPLPLLAAMCKSRPAAHPDAVRAKFSKAGIPAEVTTKVLKQHKPYLRWDPDTQLQTALKLWVDQLGSQQLSARLDKCPSLLRNTPEECGNVYLWLSDVGVDAERAQRKAPQIMTRQLKQVQSTVWAIQQVLQLTDEQLPVFLKRHVYSLQGSPERAVQTLQAVAELLALPVASKEMLEVVMVCDQRLFKRGVVELGCNISFFCEEFGGGQRVARTALKQSVFCLSPELMRARACELKTLLGWSKHERNQRVNADPLMLTRKPSTVASNIRKLQAHGFSHAQTLDMYASNPSMAGYDWGASSNLEKLMYLMLIFQLSQEEIASKASVLRTSLQHKLGPRSEFIYLSQGFSPDLPLVSSGFSSWVQRGSDAVFAAKFSKVSANPPLIYDAAFKQHWLQRWRFLTVEMGLSVADISACRALLLTSLPYILAPRWGFLTVLEAARGLAGFRAIHHLTALATMSDERFAQKFKMNGMVYDKVPTDMQ